MTEPGDTVEATNAYRVTRRLAPSGDGARAAIERLDAATGEKSVHIVEVDAAGAIGETVYADSAPVDPDETDADLFFSAVSPDLGLLATNRAEGPEIVALDPALKGTADALASAAPDEIAAIAAGDGVAALVDESLGEEPDAIRQRVLWAGPAGQGALDLDPLGLGGHRMISDLFCHGSELYILVADACAGFEVVAADLSQAAPELRVVLSRGANRYMLNAAVPAWCVVDEGVVLGTAALNDATLKIGDWGPELLLCLPDGSWDMVMGAPRFSPDGLKMPASAMTPGFGADRNAALTAIAAHGAGEERRIVAALQDFTGVTVTERAEAFPDLENYRGDVRLYTSGDLLDWAPLAADLPRNQGALTALVATPNGIILGHEAWGDDSVPLTFVGTG